MSEERIRKMDKLYNESKFSIEEFKEVFYKFKANIENYEKVRDYYSEKWVEDYDYSNKEEFPEGFYSDILNEDSIFDLMTDYHEIAIEFMELGLRLIKNGR